jgi:hypothetical protein
VDLAFDNNDHELLKVFKDDDLKEKIEELCLRRGIKE